MLLYNKQGSEIWSLLINLYVLFSLLGLTFYFYSICYDEINYCRSIERGNKVKS